MRRLVSCMCDKHSDILYVTFRLLPRIFAVWN